MKLAFWDTEISGIPARENFDDIWTMWPFGMSVAAVAYTDQPTEVWHDWDTEAGLPTVAMFDSLVCAFLAHLNRLHQDGYKLFAWNGTGFDWRLLASCARRATIPAFRCCVLWATRWALKQQPRQSVAGVRS
jgi:hypothetical protein